MRDKTNKNYRVAAAGAKLRNLLYGMSKGDLMRDVEGFAKDRGLNDIVDRLKKGALVAQDLSVWKKNAGARRRGTKPVST